MEVPHPAGSRHRLFRGRARDFRKLHHHADELHRHLCVCRARSRSAHRRRRAHIVRSGCLRRHRRLRHRLVHVSARRLALDRLAARAGSHWARRHDSRRHDAAARRSLPAAEHDRLGHCHLFPVRKHRCARTLQRAIRHSGDHHRADFARRQRCDLFLHLGTARCRDASVQEPARLAQGPRDPQPARRHRHGGKPRD